MNVQQSNAILPKEATETILKLYIVDKLSLEPEVERFKSL